MTATSYKDWLPLPPGYSTHSPHVDNLIWLIHWVMLALFLGWGAYYVYVLFKFRKREGHKAQYDPIQGKFAKYSEIGVILVEVFLLFGISMPVWAKWKTDFPEEHKALRIRVVAEQFAWNFHYAGKDGKFGRTDIKFVNNFGNSLGLDMSDPNAKDDYVLLNEMHMPINKPVVVDLSSKDVIHSFGINVLRVKQDAVPGMVNPVHFEATHTGTFDISCAQLCGLGHYRMRGVVYIETPEQFAQWAKERDAEVGGTNQ